MGADFPDFDVEEELAELRDTCDQIRARILEYSPQELIGGLWSTMLMSLIAKFNDDGDGSLPDVSIDEKNVLFAMEYLHATYAAEGLPDPSATKPVDDVGLKEILELSDKAIVHVFRFGLAFTAEKFSDETAAIHKLESTIVSNWVLIRGKRYQVMEEEFFRFVLEPHDDILQELYGIPASVLSQEIHATITAVREGIDKARDEITNLMQKTSNGADAAGMDMAAFMENDESLSEEDRERVKSAFEDMFLGGVFNVSKQSNIPHALLDDLCYEAGSEDQFLDGSGFGGTPLQTLPARVKPLIKIDGEYYSTEPNFIRDSLYRAIQRAIIKRKPEYREVWNQRQKEMSEAAFAQLMGESLGASMILNEVYYPIGKKQWAETDAIILIDDVLICLEAKAGTESLAAPSANMASHISKIEELVVKAYSQTKRFIEYIYASDEAPLYAKGENGKYVEVARIKKTDLRKVFPIGLTVETFSPYSAAVKERADVDAIVGKHSFISMSIDDLFVLRRLLRGAGEFLHYLDVRQALAGMKNVGLFDELDHVGAYISNNRIDHRVMEMMEKDAADYVHIDGMQQDILDPYFGHPEWPDCKAPTQPYPARTQQILDGLAITAQSGWLSGDSFIRDMSGEGREQIAQHYEKVLPNLSQKVSTYFAISGEVTAIFALIRNNVDPIKTDIRQTAEIAAIAMKHPKVQLFEIRVMPSGDVMGVVSKLVASPTALRQDYPKLLAEAEKMRKKLMAPKAI